MNPSPQASLPTYASVAVEHAKAEHQFALCSGSWELVDVILEREFHHRHERSRFQMLELCYGAWVGEAVREAYGGEWVGLQEPTPPRLQIQGVQVSPFDLVHRKLHRVDTRPIAATLQEFQELLLNRETQSQLDWEAINQANWNDRARDPRFVHGIDESLPSVSLDTPIDPWIQEEGDLRGKKVLCLAAGGGTHGPQLALAGAIVTVMDVAPRLLEIDQALAVQHGLSLATVPMSMSTSWSDEWVGFDLVIQPVSGCYVSDLKAVYRNVAKALKPQGVYLFQAKQPAMMQAQWLSSASHYATVTPYARQWPLPPIDRKDLFREQGTVEFLHTWDEILGDLCRSGFAMERFEEPPRGDAWAPPGSSLHRACFFPPYIKVKARKNS